MKKLIYIFLIFNLQSSICNLYAQWVEQNGGTTATLYNVEFVNPNTGWITGVNGIILKTTNAGTNWFMQSSNLTAQRILTGIDMLDANTGYIVGWYEAILKTTNGGVNWIVLREIPVGQGNSYNDVDFVNDQTGWICAFGGLTMKTTNGGVTWDSSFTGSTGPLRDVVFVNDQTGWVAGDVGYLRKTTNGGVNWFFQFFGTTADFDYNSLSFIDVNTGWLAANNNSVFKTTNSGNNWDTISLIPGRCIHFVNSMTGWTGGSNGDLYKTTNGGLNFYLQNIPNPGGFFTDIDFVNDTVGWCTKVYRIYHTTNGGTYVGVNQVSNNIPQKYNLHQNYPNPFNSLTTIKFEISKKVLIKLVVYDILGKKLETLVDENINPGIYEVIWDANNYSSGIYFYNLIGAGINITNKMILSK